MFFNGEFFIVNSKDIKSPFESKRRTHMYVNFNKGLSTLTVRLSTRYMCGWVTANLMLRYPYNGLASHPAGAGGILLVASCYTNRDKLQHD